MTDLRSVRTAIALFLLGALVAGCGAAVSSPPAATPSPVVSAAGPPQSSSGSGIVLTRTGPIGCDAIGVDYTSAMIKIDAASDPDVWAETDAGKKLAVKWSDGFTATDANPPVINGPKGEEVARAGTKINVPADGNPRLAGYFVCLGTDTVSILETDPQ